MQIKKGIPVSSGVAIGPAVVIDAEDYRVPKRTVSPDRIQQQHDRLRHALDQSRNDLEQTRQQVERELGPEPAKIFGFHLGVLWDESLINQFHALINDQHVTAEYAVYSVMRNVAKTFLQQPSPLFRERVADIWDLEKRMLGHLMEENWAELSQFEGECIVIAHNLTPSQTATLTSQKVLAICLDIGGRTSHTAIVARAQGTPCVVGMEDASAEVQSGDMVIIDGNRGLLIIEPEEKQINEYKGHLKRIASFESVLKSLVDLPSITQDGEQVHLHANIEFPEEIPGAVNNGAQGVGLYRTEFLYLGRTVLPEEEEQFETYKRAIELLEGRTMTLRTVDLGADKLVHNQMLDTEERNPFLGCRSIRLCLQNLGLFKKQLRAALRASAFGPMKIMFPLVTNVMELRQAKMILNDVMEDLDDQGIDFDRKIQIGMMIEVPSAALMARTFANEVNFFSVGTNDLIQYTLAVDRTNERVANLYSPGHPAVLQLIRSVVRAAKRGAVDISCCGEMAGELEFIMLLLGMGMRTLSMTPQMLPEVKKLIRSVTIQHCEKVARRAASYDAERQVVNFLRAETRKVIPEVFDQTPLPRHGE